MTRRTLNIAPLCLLLLLLELLEVDRRGDLGGPLEVSLALGYPVGEETLHEVAHVLGAYEDPLLHEEALKRTGELSGGLETVFPALR